MAPEPPSPSASSTLLPFLSPSRSRRGSLASIASRREIDKDVLAQALDHIHISASKSDALTSFHDYDGGSRGGAKEIVSSGVSGLYNRLKQSVGGGALSKDSQSRPKSSVSKETAEAESTQSSLSTSRNVPSISLKKSQQDNVSISTTSLAASPVLASFAGNGTAVELKASATNGRARPSEQNESLEIISHIGVKDHDPEEHEPRSVSDMPSQEEVDRARNALLENDRSNMATEALARVLSHHEIQINDRLKYMRQAYVDDTSGPASETGSMAEIANRSLSPLSIANGGASQRDVAGGSAALSDDGHRHTSADQRPLMVRVGASHLPGFEPSRASSTVDGGDISSSSTSRHGPENYRTNFSPNLNTSMQRKRIALKPLPGDAQRHNTHMPTHLKRRVISKEFWMKDENAKDCFYCGQSFSTFRRKHHCRTCGQIFDAKCTTLVPGRPFGQPGTLRLCKPCEAIIYGSDDDSTVFSDDAEEIPPRSPALRRKSLAKEDIDTGSLDGSMFSRTNTGEVATPSIGIPASRRNREAKRRSAVIEFDAQPTLVRPSSAHSLISLTRRPRSSSHRRHLSKLGRGLRSSVDERGPFYQELSADREKKLTLPAFHNDNIIDPDLAPFLSDEDSDDGEQPSIMSTLEQGASLGERERLGFGGLLSSGKKGRSKLGDRSMANSSVRGLKEDDAWSVNSKQVSKLSRKRNFSISSVTLGRPSPRQSKSNTLLKTVESESFIHHTASTMNPPPTSVGAKVLRSSSMHGSEAPPLELNNASLKHVRRLLAQLLRDNNIESSESWEEALMPILLQCTDDVEPDVQHGDDMDIRHYVKLKKVPGGKPGDTSYVSGIVFSKNLALKSMARSIRNPRIAIVTFSIEYARHQTHFMSLEPVIAQEREYLHNLVGRISALRPQLLLVQRNVSGLALRLLEEAGINVAFNIKESVLAAVARVTQTVMIKSVDKLAMDVSHLGTCESFEVKTYVHNAVRKTYIYLSGCQPDLGCTIVLRGGETKTLRKIKRVAEFMCYVVYNLKLETTLMRDEFVSIPSVTQDQLAPYDANRDNTLTHKDLVPHLISAQSDNETPSKYEQLEEECRSRILSASPFVVFMQPYALTQLREQEQRLATYKKLRDQYAAADEDGVDEKDDAVETFALVKPEWVNAPASKELPKTVREYLHAVYQAQYDKIEHAYENQKRLYESFMNTGNHPFDPLSHQQIAVLHSTVSSITSAPCMGPEVFGIGFYAGYSHVEPQFEEDCTIGQYIEDLCVSGGSTCKECGKKMHEHHRQYVHGDGQLTISVQPFPARLRGLSETILMWSSCRICRSETAVVPMSDNTWKYSFAKYLELSFWSSPLRPRADICDHDIHKEFLRCFGYQDMVVRVQYDPIDIYDVVVPRDTITWKVEADLRIKNEQYCAFLGRLNSFTDSVKKRLDSINIDTLDEKKAIEANEKLENLRVRAIKDHQELLDKLQQKYATSRYYEVIPLNRALRFMDEKAISWDEEFSNFERDYFPSETDIRKLATLQLRNMFLESQPSNSSVVSDLSDSEEGTEMKAMRPTSGRRITTEELLLEEANDVLTSTVEEHRASQEINDELGLGNPEHFDLLPGSSLRRRLSLQEEHEAIERNDIKHLDLAVAAKSPEETALEEMQNSTEQSSNPAFKLAQIGNEPFATQPKPLSSGLLERIEQIRNNRPTADQLDPPASRIPRPSDMRKRDISPISVPPPLLRAQSSPNHVPRRSADSVDFMMISPPPFEHHPIEKRLGDRLGISRLNSKVGKVGHSLIPRSIPFKDDVSTSVSALAKHFEQMSREFEKERLKERRQRALKSRQARANPLGSSRPVVEVYRNATEAVGERPQQDVSQQQRQDGSSTPGVPLATPDSLTRTQQSSDESQERIAQEIDTESDIPPPRRHEIDCSEHDGVAADIDKQQERETSDPTSTVTSSALVSPTSIPEMELNPELSISEQRKNVWFKYLADFWSKRSASGWANLEYPLHGTEHVFEDSDIIVREDEPSSVIALSLACADYQNKAQNFRSHIPKSVRKQQHAHNASQTSVNGSLATEQDEQQKAIEAALLSDTGTHMKYSFAHGSVKASCKIFYAESFDALRRRCGAADRFVESLSRCLKFDSKGGKTKSLFLMTLDNRFIIKSLQEIELKAFTKFAPDYFAFMSYTLFHGVPSVIAKMFGLFQVIIKNPATGIDFSYYLLVMENLFYERTPNRRFDLKGSMRNRKIESTGQPDEVLLDENLVETIFESPLFVREHARRLLQASVWNDTMFLSKQNVMDYSLMAGFDDTRKELIVGIIDCIRTYTWDKKLESWIKDRGKNKPTITSPKDYRNRFRVSMMQYVLQAPNCWHQFHQMLPAPKRLEERMEAGHSFGGPGPVMDKTGETTEEGTEIEKE